MSETWKRLVTGFRYNATETEISATDVYVRHDDWPAGITAANLPVPGSSVLVKPNGSTVASCLCRGCEEAYPDGNSNLPVRTYTFSTRAPGQIVPNRQDANQRQWEVGSDAVRAGKAMQGWKWEALNEPINEASDPGMIKRCSLISWTVMKETSSLAAYIVKIQACAGCVNNAAFDGWSAKGIVYFAGASGATYVDPTTLTLMYRFALKFTARIIPSISADTWQYAVTPYGNWDKPVSGSDYMFTEADFSQLL